jgi:N-acetylglucosamine transport system substrate-binding protein
MFDEHGWQVPATWDEFLALCELIKKTGNGIVPLTHQGKYPTYFGGIYLALVYKLGGGELLNDMDTLQPGAWARPELIEAARLSQQLYERDYILEGTSSFSHTEAQMIWLQGKAAMIPCGTWLESEMINALPDGFEMRIMPVPGFVDGKGGVGAMEANSSPAFWVPADAAHPDWGMEYLRIMLSRKLAAGFIENVGSVQPILGSTKDAEVRPATRSALDAVEAAGGETFNPRFRSWYLELDTEFENALGALLNHDITPERFVERMEAMAERLRRDPDTLRFDSEPERAVTAKAAS